MDSSKKILDYWFGHETQTPEYFQKKTPFWFWGGDAVDNHIRKNFEADLKKAVAGDYDQWLSTPLGCMALIILLDQFSLNLYREKPESYDQSRLAIPVFRHVIKRGWERELSLAHRVFLYLPLEHGENIVEQEESVSRFQSLVDDAPPELKESMKGYLDYAVRHHRVVKKYGRFPDRNEVYGRQSTPEEVAFLASDEAPF